MTEPRLPADLEPPRMEALARLPVFLALESKRAILAGGTAQAAWKGELLSAAGAAVEVFAEAPTDEMVALAAGHRHLDRRGGAGVRHGGPRQDRGHDSAGLCPMGRYRTALAARRVLG